MTLRWIVFATIVSSILVVSAGCSRLIPTTPVQLTLTTGPENGTFDSLGTEIANTINKTSGNVTVRAVTSEGSVDNIELLSSGRADLAIVQNDTNPKGDVYTLIPLHRGVCHFLVPNDSAIRDIYDLRGKTVEVGTKHSGNWHIVHELLDHFGVAESEFNPSHEGISACGPKLESGEVDAALVITALTSPSLTALVKRGHVRYVPLATAHNDNEVDGFAVTYPYVEKYTIPRFVYPIHDDRHGLPREPCESFALRSTLVCRGDLPDEVARTIVEAVIVNRAKIVRRQHEAHDITEHFDPADIQFPIHHGAMAYYQRQRPSFIERYSEPMAFFLSLLLAFCGLVAAFNKWFVLRKKNRIDRYYERLDALLTELNTVRHSKERLLTIEQELLAMRHDAVRELVGEKLLADESFQIFQSLLTDCHHQLALRMQSLAGKAPSDRSSTR